MEPVVTELCAERRRTIDERFARDLKDIDDCKARLKKIEELTIQMAVEHRPSMWWDKLLSAGISAGVAALISLIASVIVR